MYFMETKQMGHYGTANRASRDLKGDSNAKLATI